MFCEFCTCRHDPQERVPSPWQSKGTYHRPQDTTGYHWIPLDATGTSWSIGFLYVFFWFGWRIGLRTADGQSFFGSCFNLLFTKKNVRKRTWDGLMQPDDHGKSWNEIALVTRWRPSFKDSETRACDILHLFSMCFSERISSMVFSSERCCCDRWWSAILSVIEIVESMFNAH